MSVSIIHRLVQSAFQTGYLSVESEGLLRQMLVARKPLSSDLPVLNDLDQAIHSGRIKREAHGTVVFSLVAQK